MSDEIRQNAFDLTNIIYAKQENWDAIIEKMEKIENNKSIDKYKRARALFVIGFIYQHKLNNKEKAIEVYNEFLSSHPTHPFKKSVQMQMDQMMK